ncbi:TPA: Asp-tRNA(Asn)/Glu-tRNA(Gln) amidotransferase subunit GatB, partial [Candidatus Poribacteria bacterium]|nr:Asp-tRNA(Asn)/Glu-tRNA(Gln) amidotransferase subunit GatB [Candidatus Poribacteria bacterium]
EIVTEPDLRSPAEAVAFFKAVKEILEYLEVSDCNMEEGSYRCDANISVRPLGSQKLGTRTEVKNQNSFKAVQVALEYEEKRQIRVLEKGDQVVQETRLVDVERGITMPMRQKEEAHDYRYFPEPDLVPIAVDEDWIEEIRRSIPELPAQRRRRFVQEYGIPRYDAEVLTTSRYMADYFEETAKLCGDPKTASNWIMSDLMSLLNRENIPITQCKVTPKHLSDMIKMIAKGRISTRIAKKVLEEMFNTGKSPEKIVEEKGLVQISDEKLISEICDRVIAENPGPAQDFRNGKQKAIGFLIGQVMKLTKGKANPRLVNEILRKKLSE